MYYRFGEFSLHTEAFRLTRGRESIRVEPKAFKLIEFLIQNRYRTVSREDLQDHLGGSGIVSDNALSVCVRAARNALGDDGRCQKFIRTIPRVGYRFTAGVDVKSFPDIAIGNGPEKQGNNQRPDLEFIDRQLLSRPSIAVLPLTPINGGDKTKVLSQGLSHDVTTRIARSRAMFVIARGTAFRYESATPDVAQIGADLGVRYVAHGTIQKLGSRIRVTAILASSTSCEEIWTETYERGIDEFAAVQEELAQLIVASLHTEFERAERLRAVLLPSNNIDAWSAYHRGCWHMYRFKPDDIDLAGEYFRRSIELEPTVPRPFAGLSFINFERVFLNIEKDPASGIQRAFDYAQEALSLDPHDPMAHWALSRAYLLHGDLEESRRCLETAINLNPSYAIAQYSLGWVGLQLGEHELCTSRIRIARKLSPYDPLRMAMLGVSGLSLALSGRTREAMNLARQSVAQPNAHHQVLAFAAITCALGGPG